MGAVKQWAEQLSVALGFAGELFPEILEIGSLLQKIADKRNRKVAFPYGGGIKLIHPSSPAEGICASVYAPGDRSVGISGHEVVIRNLPCLTSQEDRDGSFREDLRSLLRTSFTDVLDDSRVQVIFSDECPDCRKKLVEGVCPNAGCPSNLPSD